MALNIGINVIETDGDIAPAVVSAPTSRAGFVIRSQRGPDDGRVTLVTSWAQFVRHFGEHITGAYGAHALAGFFANGGSTALVTRVLGSGKLAARKAFSNPSGRVITVHAGYQGEKHPGDWGKDVEVKIEHVGTSEATITIRYKRETEVYPSLDFSTPEKRARLVKRVNGDSRYVVLELDPTATSRPAATPPSNNSGFVKLEAGSDGAAVGPTAFRDAFKRFDGESVQLVCCPEYPLDETDDSAVAPFTDFVATTTGHCEALGDRMFVGHLPRMDFPSDADIDKFTGLVRGAKVYGALYGSWIWVLPPGATEAILVPPVGHVLGIYDRISRERGVWKAPAGNGSRLWGVVDTHWKVSDVDHSRFVKDYGLNLVRPIVGSGIVVDSARTLSRDSLWFYVNVRRLFNFIKSSLKQSLTWVVHEPNDQDLWDRVKIEAVRPFLLDLWRKGAFGPGTPEQVFKIKVDEENNPPSSIIQGILNIDITLYPSRPAETVVLRIGQQLGASSVSED